jgi:cytochrome c-type biogenesis protein CcmH/NrfG
MEIFVTHRLKLSVVGLILSIGSHNHLRGQAPQKQLAVYILDFSTNLKGEMYTVATDMTGAVETAFSRRRSAFRLLERRSFNDIVRQNNLEGDVKAMLKGEKPSPKFIQKMEGANADAFIRGELVERIGGVSLTVSLTRLNTEKVWQGQARHTPYEWLNPDVQKKEAEALAAEAAAALLPDPPAVENGDDGPRGIELAAAGHCDQALPRLHDAASVDTDNAEIFYWMGRCQNQAGDFNAAILTLKSAISRNPRRADLFAERARSYMGIRKRDNALEDLDRALKLDAGNVASIELRGDIYVQQSKFPEAVEAYNSAYDLNKTQSLCVKLADAYRRNGTADAAKTIERSCPSVH